MREVSSFAEIGAWLNERRLQIGGLSAIAGVLLLFAVIIPSLFFDVPDIPSSTGPLDKATVLSVTHLGVNPTPRGDVHTQSIELRIGEEVVTIERTLLENELDVMPLQRGDDVMVASFGVDPPSYYVVDYVRDQSLLLLALVFVVVVLVVAGAHGAWSLIGLAASLLIIVQFIIPGILSGHDPPVIAFFGALAIMGTTLYLAHGMNLKTTVALAGTGVSLLLAVVIAEIGIDFVRLTGLITEEATTINLLSQGAIDVRGLLLAGIIIGALGVLDDVTVAQTSAVFELRRANPRLRQTDLFQRGMNVGKDHIAATVNTLFLAYAGAALPLLIILSTQAEGLSAAASQELVATEIVRSLIGGIAITAAVPVTTLLASFLAARGAVRPSGPRDAHAVSHWT